MRFFDKLTGGGVDWQIELDDPTAAFQPGNTVAGRVRYTPKGDMQPRSIRVGLVASEHYVHLVREQRSSVSFGSSSSRSRQDDWDRQWFEDELYRQDAEISGPTSLTAGAPGEFTFQFQIPAEATPSFDSNILKLRWRIRAWMDVGGVDPSSERDVIVTAGRERLGMGESAALAPSVPDTQAQATLTMEPAPLVVGQPFRGAVETAEQLDPRNTRVEIKQKVATTGGSDAIGVAFNDVTLGGRAHRNVDEDRVLWAGQLTPAGAGQAGQRYEFSGQLAMAPVGNITLPHGTATAYLDVVISRRLFPDRHISRPVAIVTA